MNAAGIVCGPAGTGVEVLLLEIEASGQRELAHVTTPYLPVLREALTRLEAGQPVSPPLITLHGEIGRFIGECLRSVQGQVPGGLAAVACRGYLLSSGALAAGELPSSGLLLGDLGLAGAAAPDEGRPPLIPVAAVTATAYDCARLAAALAGYSPKPAGELPADFSGLLTEGRNPRTLDLDRLPTLDMLRLINAEDALVAPAVALELPRIAEAVDRVAARMQEGGRLIYVGAGTSGRLGVLDASEVPPTYGLSPDWVVARLAGGEQAITGTVEASEDDSTAGAAVIEELRVTNRDSVVGIAASGRTPYVLGALQAARKVGALTISLACNRPAPVEELADVAIAPLVGPEAVTGSTRMKAGSAQKLVLNMLSTGVMVRLGKTYGNLMVDMQASNIKLRARAVRMVALATGRSETAASEALAASGGEVKTAIVSLLAEIPVDEARRRLETNQGRVRAALEGK